jgi:hypothetical protein
MTCGQIVNKLVLFGMMIGITACFRPSIPISTGTVYPIDVFMENQAPDRPYSELQWVEISREDTLSDRQKKYSDRMLYRGNTAQTKDLLTAQLVLKAQKLGADALMNVQYRYYTSATAEGYTMRGMAIRYRGD